MFEKAILYIAPGSPVLRRGLGLHCDKWRFFKQLN